MPIHILIHIPMHAGRDVWVTFHYKGEHGCDSGSSLVITTLADRFGVNKNAHAHRHKHTHKYACIQAHQHSYIVCLHARTHTCPHARMNARIYALFTVRVYGSDFFRFALRKCL